MMRIAQKLAVVCALITSVSVAALSAQSELLVGPALGFSPNADGTAVWPIIGIPGASLLGRRLVLGVEISRAEVSPRQDYLVAIRTEDGQPVISRLSAGTAAPVAIEGTRRGETVFAISPSGPALGMFNQDLKILQVLRGFPAAPELVFEFDASNIAGRVTALAVSDDAALALLGVSRDGIDSLWVVNASTAGFIAPSHASSIAFLANRHDAVFADNASGLAFLLPAFAAAFLGSTAIYPGRFNPCGALVAVFLLSTGILGLNFLGADSFVQNLFYGGGLVIAVSISQLVRRRKAAD